MKARFFTLFVLAAMLMAGLFLLLDWSVAAQGPPPDRRQVGGGEPQSLPIGEWDGAKPFPYPAAQDIAATAAVTLGQPGLSFRYVQTFGETEVAYFSDTQHLAWPYGVGTDGTNVWIADSQGERALKFTDAGTFITQIGTPGFRTHWGPNDAPLEWAADVAVDGGGNIWVVDQDACHVLKFDSGGSFVSDLGVPWENGSDNSHFDMPVSVAFDGAGNIYVSDGAPQWDVDGGNDRIQVFSSSGSYSNTITGFRGPRHIAIYNNLLYVADSGNHRVQIFDVSNPASPIYTATIGVSGVSGSDNSHFNNPSGVAVDANYIYVADTWNHRVQVFDRATRAYVATVGTGQGTGNYQFEEPSDVTVDAAGNIYVTDFDNARVQQFNSSRMYQRTYGATGVPYLTDNYHYNRPSGVAVAADGSIYLVEEKGHRLLKLNQAGAPQWTVGTAGVPGGWDPGDNAHFSYSRSVALDAAGRIYAADTWNHRVQIFNSDGTYFATLGSGQGAGSYQFNAAYGVAVDKNNGNIYVADRNNHRVQVYDSSRTYQATLGVTGAPGADNGHFNEPYDVAVDPAGKIYVADRGNHRVQVFNSDRTYLRTIGVSGECGSDFGHLCDPIGVAVDSAGCIYVADSWGWRVQVFDNSGAYLTTIGGSSGSRTGDMRQADGLALDSASNLYIAEYLNHRLQKFAPGVPGWEQVNINGFGERQNSVVLALAPFGGQLYAGTYNWGGNGAQLWRTGSPWTAVLTNGFGYTRNVAIDHLAEFKGNLYAGIWNQDINSGVTNGGEIWRSSTGNAGDWTRVVTQGFGDLTNGEVYRFAVFSDALYASTWSYTNTHGTEIWRSSTGNSGDWTRVVSNGFNGDVNNVAAVSFEAFNGYLYAGTDSRTTGGEVWHTQNGTTWSQVNNDGFGTANNTAVSALAAFNGYLYASTVYTPGGGAQVWRCRVCDNSDWTKVVDNGFGNVNTRGMSALEVYGSFLYLIVGNSTTGMEVWRTQNGANWEQAGFAGFGDSNNLAPYWDNSVAVFNNRLYIGTWNRAHGAEVWSPLPQPVRSVAIGGPAVVAVNTPAVFTATVNTTATQPITYAWQASGQPPETHAGRGLSDTVTFTWNTTGTKVITVTTDNGITTAATAIHTATIAAPVTTTVEPTTDGMLTDTQNLTTTVAWPANAVSETLTLIYTPTTPGADPPTATLRFAGHAFRLEAYRGGVPLAGFVFSKPVTITIRYSNNDVQGVDENSLALYYWDVNENKWKDVAATCTPSSTYDRHPDENWLAVSICHLTEFALFGTGQQAGVCLPLILKNTP